MTGEFKCVADNGHATISSSAAIAVQGSTKCDAQSDTAKRTLQGKASNVAGLAPKIFMWTEGRFERIGASVQLYCRARGNPAPTVQWVGENGRSIITDSTYELLPNGDLLIKNTSDPEKTSGLYSCVVTNDFGQDKVDSFFYATEPEDV